MNIRGIIFIYPGKLSMDPPAVATRTGHGHAWCFLKKMSRQKPTLYVIRSANMTLAAACVTGAAMFVHSLADLLKNSFGLLVGPGLNNLFKGI